jgi:hypothetical protein
MGWILNVYNKTDVGLNKVKESKFHRKTGGIGVKVYLYSFLNLSPR